MEARCQSITKTWMFYVLVVCEREVWQAQAPQTFEDSGELKKTTRQHRTHECWAIPTPGQGRRPSIDDTPNHPELENTESDWKQGARSSANGFNSRWGGNRKYESTYDIFRNDVDEDIWFWPSFSSILGNVVPFICLATLHFCYKCFP